MTAGATAAGRSTAWVFVGSYTWRPGETKTGNFGPPEATSEGIYSFPLDLDTGRAGPVRLAVRSINPANLILHPSHRFLYAGSSRLPIEAGQHRITAFGIRDGALEEIGHAPCGGGIPTQGVIDRAGRFLLLANFDSDNAVSLPLGRDGGPRPIASVVGRAVGALPAIDNPPTAPGTIAGATRRPGSTRTRPHMVVLSPGERFALVPEIGSDRIAVHRFDTHTGILSPHGGASAEPGAGPRHLAFGRDGRHVYSADEDGSSCTVWRWDEREGTVTAVQRLSTLPAGMTLANKPAHVAVHPDGRHVYVNNRGHGSLVRYTVDARTGLISSPAWTMLGTPVAWHFQFTADGRWLLVANQSDSITRIYRIDAGGVPVDTGQAVSTPLPTSLQIV